MRTPIYTTRLTIDALTIDDDEFMAELVNSAGWLSFIGDRNVRSIADAVQYIERLLAQKNLTYLVIKLSETKAAIGIVSLIKRPYLPHFDIGFALLPQFSGCGYAYEATQAVLQQISHLPIYDQLLATTMPQNTRSIRLLTRLGFRFDRTLLLNEQLLHVYALP